MVFCAGPRHVGHEVDFAGVGTANDGFMANVICFMLAFRGDNGEFGFGGKLSLCDISAAEHGWLSVEGGDRCWSPGGVYLLMVVGRGDGGISVGSESTFCSESNVERWGWYPEWVLEEYYAVGL